MRSIQHHYLHEKMTCAIPLDGFAIAQPTSESWLSQIRMYLSGGICKKPHLTNKLTDQLCHLEALVNVLKFDNFAVGPEYYGF
jgi:hypothetical protein